MPHFIFIQQISVLNILNMLFNLHFSSSKCRLFHNATLFGFCITHFLNTGCAKIWKKIRRQKVNTDRILQYHSVSICWNCDLDVYLKGQIDKSVIRKVWTNMMLKTETISTFNLYTTYDNFLSMQCSLWFIRSRVQKFPAWHTKAPPNGKCCEGYIVPSMVRLMYQLKSVWK